MKYTFVIPCYSSEKFIDKTVKELTDEIDRMQIEDYEIILVNDYSPDKTFQKIVEIAKMNKKVIGIDLSQNSGQHNAILAGLRQGTGDIFVNLDDDLQTHPSQIPILLSKLKEGYDVVYGKYKNNIVGTRKSFSSLLHNKLVKWLLKKKGTWVATSFWVAKKSIINEMIKYNSEFTDMQALFIRTTQNIANAEIEHYSRVEGTSNYTFKKALKLWSSVLNFTDRPTLLLMKIGAAIIVLGTVTEIIFLSTYNNLTSDITLFSIIIWALVMLLGVIVLIAGYLGIYLIRLLKIAHNSPQYTTKRIIKNGEMYCE